MTAIFPAANLRRSMQLLRAVLVLWLAVSVGLVPAASSAALAHPVCVQGMTDHGRDCGGGNAPSASCTTPAGCAQPAVTEAPGVAGDRPEVGCPTVHAATPIPTLALAPETAPPKHSVF